MDRTLIAFGCFAAVAWLFGMVDVLNASMHAVTAFEQISVTLEAGLAFIAVVCAFGLAGVIRAVRRGPVAEDAAEKSIPKAVATFPADKG